MPKALFLEKQKLSRSPVTPEIGRYNRVGLLDLLRGFAIIFVMVYHLLYDLIFFHRMDIPFFFSETMDIIHNFFLVILFSVSGVCAGFSRNTVRRGAVLFLLGELLTLVTAAFVPDNLIVFGVLSCFGMIMLIYGVTESFFKRLPQFGVFVVFAALSVIFFNFHRSGTLYFIVDTVQLDLPTDLEYHHPTASAEFPVQPKAARRQLLRKIFAVALCYTSAAVPCGYISYKKINAERL